MHVEPDNTGWPGPGALTVRSSFRALEWRVDGSVGRLMDHGALREDCGVTTHPRLLFDASGHLVNPVLELETPDLHTRDTHRQNTDAEPMLLARFQRLLTYVSHGSNEFLRVVG